MREAMIRASLEQLRDDVSSLGELPMITCPELERISQAPDGSDVCTFENPCHHGVFPTMTASCSLSSPTVVGDNVAAHGEPCLGPGECW
jgi:hypothetical protein